jgi:hypothetical protein
VYGFAVARLLLAGRDCPVKVASAMATVIPVSETIPPALRMR